MRLKCVIAVIFLGLAAAYSDAYGEHRQVSFTDLSQLTVDGVSLVGAFGAWKNEHQKKYAHKEEDDARFRIFVSNYLLINEHNKRPERSFEMGLNSFADLSWDQFKTVYLLAPQNCSATKKARGLFDKSNLPTSVDWRSMNVISHVKNQGGCGSCWTFSTTGAVEAHYAIKTGQLRNLSEQQLLDCSENFNNHGCDGGLPSQAFEYIHEADGLTTEDEYPYTAAQDTCALTSEMSRVKVRGSYNITEGDEEELSNKLATEGPISIAYEVTSDFRFYKDGVYSSNVCRNTSESINHAVLAVGYGATADGTQYFIVKNSWGETFGMNGYFLIKRNENMCGLATCASYPIME